MRSYLVGQIHANWLDDDQEDLVRSDRQDILWNTDRGQALKEWGQALIRQLGRASEGVRREQTWGLFAAKSRIQELVEATFPAGELQDGVLAVAKAIARTFSRDELENKEQVDAVVNLALAVGPHRVLVQKLQEASTEVDSPFSALVSLFTEARIAEMYSLGQIADERVRIIEKLERTLSAAQNEGELQKLIEEAPWLIDPQWTLLTRNQNLETFRAAFERWYEQRYGERVVTSAIDYPSRRPDFVLMDFGRALQVVEIKRPGHRLSDADFQRLHKYYEAIRQFLGDHPQFNEDFPNQFRITLVCDEVELTPINRTAYAKLEDDVLRRVSWEVFLRKTKKMHEAFLFVARIRPDERSGADEPAAAGTEAG